MGYNLAGLLIRKKLENTSEIESLLKENLNYTEEVGFEDATTGFEENILDVLHTEKGTLLFYELGRLYDVSSYKEEVIQFMVSDVSDTYYFEHYNNEELKRKYITSQGEIAEDIGTGSIDIEEDLIDEIWELTNQFLESNSIDTIFESNFKRYQIN